MARKEPPLIANKHSYLLRSPHRQLLRKSKDSGHWRFEIECTYHIRTQRGVGYQHKQVCKQGAAEVWLEVDGLRFRGFKRVQNRLCPAQLGRGAWIYTNILVGYSWSSPPTAVGTSGLATLKTPRIPCCSGKHGKTREISQNCGSREEKFHASALTWEFGHPKNS